MKAPENVALFRFVTILLLAISLSGCGRVAEFLGGGLDPIETETSPTDPIEPVEGDSQISTSTPPETPSSENETTFSQVLRQNNCQEPSQNDYIQGTYNLGWTAAGYRHEGILQMQGDVGVMRIKFFNRNTSSEDIVDQSMILANCPQGLVLLGFNPISPDTNEAHPTYVADNLIMRLETDGSVTVVVVDNQGVTAPVEIEQISN